MALYGSYEGSFTEDEVNRFYPILEKEYKIGYKFDCPLRASLKSKFGMKALNRLRDFTENVLPQFPDHENTLPTLEQLLNATQSKRSKDSSGIIITCEDDEIEVNRRRRKSFGCSLL